jgi:hypothetical protein
MSAKPCLKIISFKVNLYLRLFTIMKMAKSLFSCINEYRNQISVNYIRNTGLSDDVDICQMVTTSMSTSILRKHTHTHTHVYISLWYMDSKTTEIFTSVCLLKYKSRSLLMLTSHCIESFGFHLSFRITNN